MKDSSGLYPSVYGGGGSLSSEEPSFLGSENEALVSATTAEELAGSRGSSTGAGGAKAGGQAGPGSVTLYARLESGEGAKKRDEKGGGCAEELEAEAGGSGGAA